MNWSVADRVSGNIEIEISTIGFNALKLKSRSERESGEMNRFDLDDLTALVSVRTGARFAVQTTKIILNGLVVGFWRLVECRSSCC